MTTNTPIFAGSDATVSATFTDLGTDDTHIALIDWDNGSPEEMVSVNQAENMASGSHTFNDVGVYTVGVTIEDDDLDEDFATTTITVLAMPEGEGEGEGSIPQDTAQDILREFDTADADDSGDLSFDEARSVTPDLTMGEFDAIDRDGDGRLSMNELVVATVSGPIYSADQNGDQVISLSELLRAIQFFNSDGYHCEAGTEDGYAPGPGDQNCLRHAADTAFDLALISPSSCA